MKIEISHIKKSYDKAPALTDISFSVNDGEFVSVIGSSGAGKTTLFRLLNGSEKPDSGYIFMDGQEFTRLTGKKLRDIQRRIGTIYQDFCLVEPSSCLKNTLHGSLPEINVFQAAFGLFGNANIKMAKDLLSLAGLTDQFDQPVKTLSGGQKQRVAIARALMLRPSLLLADEPASSLDPVTGRQIIELIKQLQQSEGITVLMNSHNLEFAMDFSDRIIGLNKGKCVFDDTPGKLSGNILPLIYGETDAHPVKTLKNGNCTHPQNAFNDCFSDGYHPKTPRVLSSYKNDE